VEGAALRPAGCKGKTLWNCNRGGRLDIGGFPGHGNYSNDASCGSTISPQDRLEAAFTLELIARLQAVATGPMIDIRADARWRRN
jgi:hypothetical protein